MSGFGDYIASQCTKPHCAAGRTMTRLMNRGNRLMYTGIVDELEYTEC